MSLTCQDVMIAPEEQILLHPNSPIDRAFKQMRHHGMRYLPVVEKEGTYVGVFTSPTLIKLMLPRAMTIQMGGRNPNKGLHDLNFLNMDDEDFYTALDSVKDEPVKNYLSNPKNIPVAAPDTPIMEGILLLHKYKRHVILVNPDNNQFVGVLSINSALKQIFDEDYTV